MADVGVCDQKDIRDCDNFFSLAPLDHTYRYLNVVCKSFPTVGGEARQRTCKGKDYCKTIFAKDSLRRI